MLLHKFLVSLALGEEVCFILVKTHWYLVLHANVEIVNHHEKVQSQHWNTTRKSKYKYQYVYASILFKTLLSLRVILSLINYYRRESKQYQWSVKLTDLLFHEVPQKHIWLFLKVIFWLQSDYPSLHVGEQYNLLCL